MDLGPICEDEAARGVKLSGNVASDPKDLGQVLTDLQEKPGQLRDILGGGDAQAQEQAPGSNPIIDMLSSPMAKAVLAGIAGGGGQAHDGEYVPNVAALARRGSNPPAGRPSEDAAQHWEPRRAHETAR